MVHEDGAVCSHSHDGEHTVAHDGLLLRKHPDHLFNADCFINKKPRNVSSGEQHQGLSSAEQSSDTAPVIKQKLGSNPSGYVETTHVKARFFTADHPRTKSTEDVDHSMIVPSSTSFDTPFVSSAIPVASAPGPPCTSSNLDPATTPWESYIEQHALPVDLSEDSIMRGLSAPGFPVPGLTNGYAHMSLFAFSLSMCD